MLPEFFMHVQFPADDILSERSADGEYKTPCVPKSLVYCSSFFQLCRPRRKLLRVYLINIHFCLK